MYIMKLNNEYILTLQLLDGIGNKSIFKILEQIYGKDCTNAYNHFHKYLNIDNFLSKFQIGTIKKNHK